jgi:butyryl-CoA dehydrogenase
MDLVGRKLLRDMGSTAGRIGKGMKATIADLKGEKDPHVSAIRAQLENSVETLTDVSTWIGMNAMGDLRKSFACSVPYLHLWGITAAGEQMARAAGIAARKIAAGDPEREFYQAKLITARFYADHILSRASWLRHQIMEGSSHVMSLSEEQFQADRKVIART